MNTTRPRPHRLGRRLAVAALLVASTTAALAPGTASAGDHTAAGNRLDRAEVTSIDDGSRTGSAMLHRSSRGIAAVLRTGGLERGHAHTVWAVIFNHPDACDGACDAADLSNPDVGGSSRWLAGRVARHRHTTFTGHVPAGDALTDPKGAEVHLVVRSHGPVIRGLRHEQLTTLNGGCPPNACANIQVAIHEG